jgi:peptidoglycan-associated lipoprotein
MRFLWFAPLIAVFGTAPRLASANDSATANAPALACAPVKVHFALDSDRLYDSEKPILDTTAQCLSSNDKQHVTIVGNADERGTTEYNQALGQRRADRVARYLEEKGASPVQVEAVISHGEESPLCQESDLKCWQLNRRTAVRESCHM